MWSNAKYSAQRAQVKGGQLDLARFSSPHGIIVNFHIQGQTSRVIHTHTRRRKHLQVITP